MPILDVEIVGEPPLPLRVIARNLAEAAGKALNARPMGAWIKVRVLPEDGYAENAGGPPAGVRPVWVRILHRTPPAGEALRSEVESLTAAIARVCGRAAENVHLIYEAPAIGRVAFGGSIVE